MKITSKESFRARNWIMAGWFYNGGEEYAEFANSKEQTLAGMKHATNGVGPGLTLNSAISLTTALFEYLAANCINLAYGKKKLHIRRRDKKFQGKVNKTEGEHISFDQVPKF